MIYLRSILDLSGATLTWIRRPRGHHHYPDGISIMTDVKFDEIAPDEYVEEVVRMAVKVGPDEFQFHEWPLEGWRHPAGSHKRQPVFNCQRTKADYPAEGHTFKVLRRTYVRAEGMNEPALHEIVLWEN